MQEFKKIRLWRLYLVEGVFTLLFILWTVRLASLQIGKEGQRLRLAARKQFFKSISLPARRGIIYDRTNRPLTVNVGNIEVYQNGDLSKTAYETLKRYGLSPKRHATLRRATRIGVLSYEYIDSLQELIRKEKINIFFNRYWTRYTVIEEGYSSLIGYVGKDGYGLSGIEKYMENYLKGINGKLPCIVTGIRDTLYTLEREKIDPTDGKDIKLSIDGYFQEIAYAALKEKVDELSAKGGFVIITNPKNGEIISMVSYPVKSNENFVLAYPYEPGSTFKIVVYSRALDDGIINPFDSVDTHDGKLIVDKKTIQDVHKMGKITWLKAFSHSSNVAAAELSLKLGTKKVYEQMLKLGFGCPTGSFLKGQCRFPLNYKKWKDSKLATLGIGYGLLVNGLQMAMAYGAVANGGYLFSPKIMYDKQPVRVRKPMGERSLKYLKLFMRNVVKDGTGKKASLGNLVSVCGKTGTAMVYDSEKHRYDPKRKVTSFIGFFPCNRPEYLIYVVIFEPKGTPWLMYGGEVAAPVFKKIAENIIWRKVHENI